MELFEKKYKRLIRKKKVFACLFLVLIIGAFLTGLTGFIVCAVKNNDSMLVFFAVLGFAVPIVMLVAYLVATMTGKDKAKETLDSKLLKSELSADEVLKLGENLNLDLFGIAALKRAKELGLEHLPEGCIRDRILPTKDDLLK